MLKRQKRKPVNDNLVKVVTVLLQNDKYGFFSVPVDPQLVPDYHTVINTPMDLGTMFEKASNGDYNGMDDVKNDFVQVITNAKLYNRPDTVYYKEAERLFKACARLFKDQEPKKPITKERRSAKKIKHYEDLEESMQEQIEIDGTLVKNHTYQFTIPQLTPIQQFLRTCSFAAQDVLHGLDDSVLFLHHPSIEPSQQQFVKSVYGSAQGKYYSDSLEHFTRNCGPRVQEIVKKKLDLITGDMHSLSRLTMEALNSDTNPIADTWLGKIDVRKALEQQKAHQLFESQSKHLQQFRELGEQAQQLMIQLPATVKPGDYSSVGENDLLLENVQDLASVNALIASGKPLDPNVMERVRTRLLTLISRGPDSRIQLAPPTMMRPQPVQQNFLPNLRPVMPNMNTLLLMQQQQIAMMNMRPVMPQCMDCGTIIQVCKLRIAY